MTTDQFHHRFDAETTDCDTCYDTLTLDTEGSEVRCHACAPTVLIVRGITPRQAEILRAVRSTKVQIHFDNKTVVVIYANSAFEVEQVIEACGARLTREARRQGKTGRSLPSLQINSLIAKIAQAAR